MEREVLLGIESAGYYPKETLIRRDLLNLSEPVVNIRLYSRPNLQGAAAGCEWLTGRLGEEQGPFPAEVTAERIRPVGLQFSKYEQAEGEHRLFFRGFTKEQLIGRPYLLKDMVPPVPFVLTERRGINEYVAELPKGSTWKADEGASLLRIYRSISDPSGAYAIPVESGEACRLL